MLRLGEFKDRIIAQRTIAARPARYGDFPEGLHPDLVAAVQAQGFEKLYSHQADMVTRAMAGENCVITTGTASGKSLAYLLPILQAILDKPESRAILLFPTKALAQDQLRGVLDLIEPLGESRVQAGVYDGDTPPVERKRVRERCHLILTNPDMLNSAYLPNHGRRGFSHIFRNLKFLVVDEMHGYRGAFGSHVSNLMRRFWRLCNHYHSDPQVLASSATIANPRELAEKLFERPFSLVEADGSPSSGKEIHFWQPPIVDQDFRRSVVQEMSDFLPVLVAQRQRTIGFCRSRKETEIVLKESRDALASVDGGHDESHLIAGYRAGYTPLERRAVEKKLLDGDLMSVVSTNALELGIDVGALEVVVQAGFPGTRASFWQQIGRAGRRQSVAQAFVILRMAPLDQYVAMNPDWLVNQKAENAVVDRDNLMIQLAHIRAAAAELPLTVDDAARFPDLGEAIPVLLEAGEIESLYGSFHWRGDAHPAGDFSLRNIDRDRFKIVNRETGDTLSEMDRPQTYREAHIRAVYLHDGLQFLVEKLDLIGHQVLVRPVEQNFYTEPDVRTTIDVLNLQEERPILRSHLWFGDIEVEDATVGYKMLQFHNHQNLGYEALPERLAIELETEGVWLRIPKEVLEVFGGEERDYLRGMLHGVLAAARMRTMAEGSDLNGSSFHFPVEETGLTITVLVLYDTHPGGLGFAQKSYDEMESILEDAVSLARNCRCKSGCPACVGDYHLDRALVRWGLESLFEEVALPKGRRALPRPPVVRTQRVFSFEELDTSWDRFVAALPPGEEGVAFLRRIMVVQRRGSRLILDVASPGLARWVNEEKTGKRLSHLIAEHARVPSDFRLEARVAEEQDRQRADRRGLKLRRRLEDIVGESENDES